ncbi:NUDIX hydrolase [Spirosoma utsteinense]|uniref:GDP-mannose pyrophosphatase n=1 Tax=Spirosoma utsteinense TaxID=2585773 RepID=A0ABR6WCZ3_9BACT|nr:NUDIX hydrolase [Spirosoma utsteinense]MBC3787493.1 8-oxo-dGTP pyrophosphatase MutT (NUDIX family) [Spirosoma utsteinense]MBC3794430.1 8-oxo-dGTP pyrophosphatase MutT (NUDIX family) [Spirosoma utsteinense]
MNEHEQLEQAPKYRAWRRALANNQITVSQVEPLYVHQADKDGSMLYALLKLDADTAEGTKLNPICFLKGDAVSMLVILIAEETNEKYVLLVRQRRVCDGSITHEHPAGMIDEDDPSPIEVAARELGEEAQLTVDPSELKPLFDKPLFSATSTTDEALHFFYLERRMPLADIQAMNDTSTGEEEENEHTQLQIVTIPEAHKLVSNLHGVMSHLLYLQLTGDYETMARL